ncbi:MAG: hypothetical protein ABI823_19610, partial [Bryobacteraceae bacterium]
MNDRRETETPPGAPSEESIRGQLAAILGSPPFATANRSRRFLEYVVEQTLAGSQGAIKEIVIGTEVFDRKSDFDPRVDTIVRVEAGKLRTRLQEYYAGHGIAAPVLIEVPKGTYVPRFSSRAEAVAPPVIPAKITRTRAFRIVAVVLLAGVAGLWVVLRAWYSPAPVVKEITAVAVLPFLNLSSDPENEYFSDGLADQLTDALTRVDGLQVVSRTSAFSFKGKPIDAAQIGAQLHVNAIVEGSVQKSADQVRVTLQLIRTSDGYHLWSQTFDRKLQNIFAVQDEISRAVTHALRFSIADDSSRSTSRRYTKDPEAFDLYLRGRHALLGLEPDGAGRAIALFQRAIDRDPKFALAFAGIAQAAAQGIFSELLPPTEIRRQVKAAAEKALELDDSLAEAHAVLADVEARFDWNWTGAEKRFRKAIQLNPRSTSAHIGYAQSVLLPLRRFDEALSECGIARELDPLSAQVAYCVPWVHMTGGQEGLAYSEFLKLQSDHAGNPSYDAGVVISAIHSGHIAEAISIIDRGPVDPSLLIGQSPAQLGFLAYAYGRAGRNADVSKIEHHLKELVRTRYVPPGTLCTLYLGSGRIAEARAAAADQIREHGANVMYLALDPMFAPLRGD